MQSPLVIIVDDDPLLLEFMTDTLIAEGYRVQTAADGWGGFSAVDAGRPDLVVLDVRMPGQSGLDVLRQIRDTPWGRELPVLMLTGQGRIDRVLEARQAGASDYLMKPFRPDDLTVRVRRLLDPVTA